MTPDDLLPIPGGAFLMGQENGRDDERPAHRVTVAPFRLGRTQVTNADYAAFRPFAFEDGTLPVTSVSPVPAVTLASSFGYTYGAVVIDDGSFCF